jgi:hypothetical protein
MCPRECHLAPVEVCRDAEPQKCFIRSVMDNDSWLVMPRDHRLEEETYSHASRESDRNGNETLHRANEN